MTYTEQETINFMAAHIATRIYFDPDEFSFNPKYFTLWRNLMHYNQHHGTKHKKWGQVPNIICVKYGGHKENWAITLNAPFTVTEDVGPEIGHY